MALVDSSPRAGSSSSSSRRSSWAALMQNYEDALEYRNDDATSDPRQAGVTAKMALLNIETTDALTTRENINDLELQTIAETTSLDTPVHVPQITIDNTSVPVIDLASHEQLKPRGPFHKWMQTIHRRARHRHTLSDGSISSLRPRVVSDIHSRTNGWRRSHYRQSSSGSSFAFVSAVRSASASLASVSAVARSRRNTTRSQGFSTTERSSRASLTGPRASEDSSFLETHSLADLASLERSLQRRRVLEELISTEEGYIGDIRFLMNVYVTILAALPSICVGLRSSINQNLTEIVKLHEELLGELHRAVPHSEYTQVAVSSSLSPLPNADGLRAHSHRRWSSLGTIPDKNMKARWLLKAPGMLSDPQVAAEVSKVFGKKINRLFIYEEYGATYEMMIKDIASAQQAIPEWETYQKGLEALAMALGSAKGSEEGAKKALTINDLLVKPIQRICKYPLLFSELLKCTPISDCPNSHMEVDNTLTRLREATTEINRASDDERMKSTLEKTWILQDRLVFPDRVLMIDGT
ncbi:round spore [Trichoderma arundinaceum]|uniref:Round spore n=1 Tax=Trichoderma arundinaceum TaxID=490622 RepID=A0A395N8U0_TRIAR|nr:round spore [Trichoderma arundinaceum]